MACQSTRRDARLRGCFLGRLCKLGPQTGFYIGPRQTTGAQPKRRIIKTADNARFQTNGARAAIKHVNIGQHGGNMGCAAGAQATRRIGARGNQWPRHCAQ